MHKKHEVPEAILKEYNKEESLFDEIYSKGFASYTRELPRLLEAFAPPKKCICCMDEGTPEGMHAAGSGILLNEEQLQKYFQETKPEIITSHDGCGAAKIYAKANGLNEEEADKIGREWAEKQAAKFGLKHEHILGTEMSRPTEGHFARVCYYDTTGVLNWNHDAGLPAGFVVSRKFMDPEYALKEVSVASNIAFGHHGLSEELLSEEKPFLFVAVAATEAELEQAMKELKTLAHTHGKKIRVEGFVVPVSA
jgi:hypothetical protein